MEEATHKYSFVMPAYKATFIQESIASILNQSYQDFELIIVDDASPDDIKSIVDQFQDKRIRYYRNEQNIGGKDLVAQWNHSLSFSNADWFILATDDDVYEPEFLATADRLLTKYPQVDIFRGRICHFSKNDKIDSIENCLPELTYIEEFVYALECKNIRYGIPQYVFRRKAINDLGGFVSLPIAWGSDNLTAEMLSENGIVCSSNVLLKFRDSEINLSKDGVRELEKLQALIKMYAYLYSNVLQKLIREDIYMTYFSNKVKSIFPFDVKKQILEQVGYLSIRERVRLIPTLLAYTPYLDTRNKSTILLRLFIDKNY